MPKKTFLSTVLTSADVNTYLMNQAVITCTSGTRPSGPVEGMTIYETDTDMYAVYDGSAWKYNLGGYQAFTPTWSGAISAIGNAVVTARYSRVGRTINYHGTATFGTTTAFTAGNLTLNLPVTAASAPAWPIGTWFGVDTSSTPREVGVMIHGSTTTIAARISGGGLVTNLVPWTWANTDTYGWNVTYEAAA